MNIRAIIWGILFFFMPVMTIIYHAIFGLKWWISFLAAYGSEIIFFAFFLTCWLSGGYIYDFMARPYKVTLSYDEDQRCFNRFNKMDEAVAYMGRYDGKDLRLWKRRWNGQWEEVSLNAIRLKGELNNDGLAVQPSTVYHE